MPRRDGRGDVTQPPRAGCVASGDWADRLLDRVELRSQPLGGTAQHIADLRARAAVEDCEGTAPFRGQLDQLRDFGVDTVRVIVEPFGANVFAAPNFAISAVLMMQFAVQAAKHMARAEIRRSNGQVGGSGMAIAVSPTIRLGGMLSAIAAAYTIGLNDEPGCRLPSTGRR